MTAPSAIAGDLGVAEVHRVDRRLVALLAVGSGATVANLYYVQPLLPELARTFHVSDGTAGLLVTIAQISYATGLILIVPLGDLVHRRALAVRLLCGCAVGLALAALAPGFAVLAGALAVVALASVVLQILIRLRALWPLRRSVGRSSDW